MERGRITSSAVTTMVNLRSVYQWLLTVPSVSWARAAITAAETHTQSWWPLGWALMQPHVHQLSRQRRRGKALATFPHSQHSRRGMCKSGQHIKQIYTQEKLSSVACGGALCSYWWWFCILEKIITPKIRLNSWEFVFLKRLQQRWLKHASFAYSDPVGLRWQWRRQYRSQKCRQRLIFHRGLLWPFHMWLELPPDRCFHWRPKQGRCVREGQDFYSCFIFQHVVFNKHLMWWTCKHVNLLHSANREPSGSEKSWSFWHTSLRSQKTKLRKGFLKGKFRDISMLKIRLTVLNYWCTNLRAVTEDHQPTDNEDKHELKEESERN